MAAILFLGVFFGLISAGIAYDRGRSALFWFIFGFLFHILGVIVIFLPRVARAGVNKECQNCKEVIKAKAVTCRYCGAATA